MVTQNSTFYNSTGVFIDAVGDYGVIGDGVTDDTVAIAAAISAANTAGGGIVFFRAGTYKVNRVSAAANLYSHITIVGVGDATIFTNAGLILQGNENYNIFSGSNLTDIKFLNFKVTSSCAVSLTDCSDVLVENVTIDGSVSATYNVNKGLYFYTCSRLRVKDCNFKNLEFGSYYTGTAGSPCSDVLETGCVHWNETIATAATFPVGSYLVYARRANLVGNIYRNLNSPTVNGTEDTGMGYGIYEGDGLSYDVNIVGNVCYTSLGSVGRMIGIYSSCAENLTIVGNTTTCELALAPEGGMYHGIEVLTANGQHTNVTIEGNTLKGMDYGGGGIRYQSYASQRHKNVAIKNNIVTFGQIRVDAKQTSHDYPLVLSVTGNQLLRTVGHGIYIVGQETVPTSPVAGVLICDNQIRRAKYCGIVLASNIVQSIIRGNLIEDCNTANEASELLSSGILFTSYGYGGVVEGNAIRNTVQGAGHIKYGIDLFSSVQVYKFQLDNNSFSKVETADIYQGYTAASTAFDWSVGEAHMHKSQTNRYVCTATSEPSLTVNASSASTTVTCSSTAGMLAGDVVWLIKGSDFFDKSQWMDVTKWHQTTVQSVTNGTDFVVTDAIPAGDGTYVAGTAIIKTLRWATVY